MKPTSPSYLYMAAKPPRVSFWLTFSSRSPAVDRAKIFIDTRHGSWGSAQADEVLTEKGGAQWIGRTELMAAFETVVHRDFPNPQRIGCPGHGFLLALAAGRRDDQSAQVLSHIRECAPCFDGLNRLRATNKRDNR